MGSEVSTQEGRVITDDASDRNAPLRFHDVHGDNVKLEKNKTVACRPEGFCKGIAFSHRPIKVREPVYIKFVDISSNWSGALRIGFTMNDPNTMKSKLPLYACPNLTSLEGNWVKAIAERMAKKDSILYYYVEQNGDVYYGIDSISYGFFFGGVCTSDKLWAVLDIYGNTIGVEFLNPDPLTPERSISSSGSMAVIRNKDMEDSAMNAIPDQNDNVYWEPHIRGRNARIDGCHHAYRKTPTTCKDHAYIFLSQSLKLGWRMALEVIQVSPESTGSLVYGVTSCNPANLKQSELPKDPNDLVDRPEYWIVKYDSNSYHERDIIIYSIDKKGEVSVRRNKDKFDTFHVDPTQPIWLFFNIVGWVSGLGIIGAVSSDEVVAQMEKLKVSEKDGSSGSLAGPSNEERDCSECMICCEEPVDCALYRCGHMCMCYKCATKMWQPGMDSSCPICRKKIIDVIKIYK